MNNFLFVLVLVNVSHHALGVVVVEVDEGASATLPCRSPFSGEVEVVEWRRATPVLTVHIRRNGRDIQSDHTSLYAQRTTLKADAHKSGDLSLTLSNVMIFDKGVYVCSVKEMNVKDPVEKEVELQVNLKRDPVIKHVKALTDAVIAVGVVMGLGFILIGLGGYCLYKQHAKG